MKKLLILVMVLAMASFAGAALRIVGAPLGDVQQSDIVLLGISTDAPIGYQTGDYYFLVADVMGGTMDNQTGITLVADTGVMVERSVDAAGFLDGTGLLPLGTNGIGGGAFAYDLPAGIPANTALIGDIAFHCEGPGDVIVQLWTTDFSGATLVDSIIIHQVPEPVTMALLGLGGLFLRRRMA